MRPRALTRDIAGDGDVIVLIPGGLTGWLSWIPHQEHLSSRYRVIRVQPIHNELGSAGQPGDPAYTRDIERESLRLTLDELQIDQAHFAGWSSGGRALIEFTLAHPDRVWSATLVEPGAYWVLEKLGQSDPVADEANRLMYGLAGKTMTEDDFAVFLASSGFVDDPSQAQEHPYWEQSFPHRMALSWASEALMGSDHTPEDLMAITCPTLLTKGTKTSSAEQRVVDIIGDLIPDARVVELEGGHAHHIETIDRFLAEFEGFLDSVRLS